VIGTTLITGADGYVGRLLTARLLAGSDDRLILAVRARTAAELDAKRSAFDMSGPRVAVIPADLAEADAFGAVEPYGVTRIVHGAAVTRFNVDRATAQRVNVDGTAQVCAFARRCDRLERLLLLSSVYAGGRRTGPLEEVPYDDGPGFVNHYEWSKWAAETTLLSSGLPGSILRLATIVADDEDGTVTQYNAFHNTFKLFFYGLLSIVPGDAATPVHIVSGRFVADVAERALDPAVRLGIHHACLPGSPTLGEIIDTAFTAFEADPGFRRRGLLRPPYCDLAGFHDLLAVARSTRSGAIHDALESVAPFAEQLYLRKAPAPGGLGVTPPDPRALITRTCEHLVATHWGRARREER
jgi:nucleoside-diphosphate-sugar epimerase